MNTKVLLPTSYLAPLQYYSKLTKYDDIHIEIHENFTKQTYRNRCEIYGANGKLSISIPVKKSKTKTKIKDALIDYDTNWPKIHWKSIESAYRSSPFFEFYEDELRPFYETKFKYLIDFNLEIQQVILENLDLNLDIRKTESYKHKPESDCDDLRSYFTPKKDFNEAIPLNKYKQVFMDKHGFIPDLSIIDLLFNEGPNASELLNLQY